MDMGRRSHLVKLLKRDSSSYSAALSLWAVLSNNLAWCAVGKG